MSKWEDGFEKANGLRTHYYRTGGDKPQVVLLHGAMDDGLCWTRVAKALEPDYDVIMPDARGHGMSDSGAGDYSAASRALDAIGAIEALKLDRPVIGGHSMGADTAMQIAVRRPDLVRGIYMEDPPVVMPGEPIFGGKIAEKVDVGKALTNPMRMFKLLPAFMTKPLVRKMMPAAPDDEIIPWLKSKKRLSGDFLHSMKAGLNFDEDAFDIFAMIQQPAMLIMGDRDLGAIVSKEVAGKLTQSKPDLKVVYLEGANHDIRRAKYDGYIAAIKGFLKELYG